MAIADNLNFKKIVQSLNIDDNDSTEVNSDKARMLFEEYITLNKQIKRRHEVWVVEYNGEIISTGNSRYVWSSRDNAIRGIETFLTSSAVWYAMTDATAKKVVAKLIEEGTINVKQIL